MSPSPRLGAKLGPTLTLSIPDPAAPGGVLERAWAGELTECSIEADSGETALTSPYQGEDAAPWFIRGEAVQSTARDSLWRLTWDRSGERLTYAYAPNGNAVATPDQPILRGTLTVGPRPQLGGAATDGTFVFSFDWALTGEPTFDLGEA